MTKRFTLDMTTPSYSKNLDRYGEHTNTCCRCGKRTADGAGTVFAEMDTGGGESQGMFPVGPECAKAFKKAGVTLYVDSATGGFSVFANGSVKS